MIITPVVNPTGISPIKEYQRTTKHRTRLRIDYREDYRMKYVAIDEGTYTSPECYDNMEELVEELLGKYCIGDLDKRITIYELKDPKTIQFDLISKEGDN